MIVYFSANVELADPDESKLKTWLKIILLFPIFLAVSMGLSLHNSVAVIQGFRGKKSAFIRTPKFNIKGLTDTLNKKSTYMNSQFSWITATEGLLSVYFLLGLFAAWYIHNNTFILFHILLFIGYSTVFFYSIKHSNVEK